MLQLSCFGDFQVFLDDVPLTNFQTDKVRALLAYLVIEAQPQQRSALAQFLWPGYSEESANNSLRQSIHRLRQLLHDAATDPPWLLITRQTIQLNPAAAIQADVTTFTQLITAVAAHAHDQLATCSPCLAHLQQAVDLYQGDFLADFSVADSDPFEEWRRITQEQLHLQVLDALTRLGYAAETAGDDEAAQRAAQRQLALEPWLESAHRRLMRVLAGRGQRAAAIAQYQRCRQVLAAELGVEPDSETTALYEAIRSGAFPVVAPQRELRAGLLLPTAAVREQPVAAPELPLLTPPPFFAGRSQELAQLDRWWRQSCAGQGQFGFVVGEAGSGKSTLLRAFVQRVRANAPRSLIAVGGCDEYVGRGVPFLPWRTLLSQLTLLADEPWLPALFTPAGAEQQSPLSPEQLLVEVAARLTALAAQQPLLLIFEDLHWADLSSLHLLLALSQRVTTSPLLVLGSFRPEGLTTEGEFTSQPLPTLIRESKRLFGQVLIDLDTLLPTARQQFVDDWLDQEPNQFGAAFRQALLRHTEGHALFLNELLQELRARGVLTRNAAGEWVAQATLQWQTLPTRVEGAIESQMARLPAHLRQLLRIAAVEGEEFTAEVVSQVAGVGLAQVRLWLSDELERCYRLIDGQRAEWVAQQRLSFYRFRHQLFQQYLYQSLSPIEQANHHAQVGQVLEALYSEQRVEIAHQLAYHFARAGMAPQAIDYYALAGEKARAISANTEAIAYFRTALALLQTVRSPATRVNHELNLQLALGSALVTVHGYAAAEVGRTLQRAQILYQQTRALPAARQAASAHQYGALLHGLHRFYYMRGEWPAARQAGEQLMELAAQSEEPFLQAEAPRALGMALWHQGEFAAAHQLFEQGIAAYDPALHTRYLQLSGQDPGMICTAYTAWGLWMLGYPTQARERLERCLALATALDHPFTLIYALQYAAVFAQFCGDAAATLTHAEAVIALAQQHGFTYYLGWGAILRGWAQVQQGQTTAGLAELQQGLADWQATGARLARHYYLGLLADAYLTAGQRAAGLAAVAEALATTPASGQFWAAELYRLRGELFLLAPASGEDAQALAAIQQAVTIANGQGAKLLELRAVCSRSRLWQRQGDVAAARTSLQSSLAWFTAGVDNVDLAAARALSAALDQLDALPVTASSDPIMINKADSAVIFPIDQRAQGGAQWVPANPPPPRDLAIPSEQIGTKSNLPLPVEGARPPTAGHRPTLPVALTPLIGRAQAVTALCARLQKPAVRLLTIMGAGGMGKTRLAIAVGHAAQATFADGVYFVELAAISSPTAMAAAIATAVGLPLQGAEPRNLLLQAIQQKQLLLILDNFEHLLAESSELHHGGETPALTFLSELLAAAPALQLLVTSRTRLNLRYEHIYTIQPLAFAPAATPTAAADMTAVRLFVQAAQRLQADFELTTENLAPLLRICQLVQGMPLGLELAAANIDQLPLAAIADAIAENAEFLTVDWRDMPERQRSMSAVFQWSWQLLDDQERQVLRQLALFPGSFTGTAAERIAGAAVPVLTRLVHKSLLQVSAADGGERRYHLHELLRQFAAAELAKAQATAATANRHSTYYLSLLAEQQPSIMHNASRAAIAVIQSELDNIRQAWRWGAGHLPATLVEQSALALREFYWLTGLTTEAIEMFDVATQLRAGYQQQQYPALLAQGQNTAPTNQPTDRPNEIRVYSILAGMAATFQLVVGRHAETLVRATAILQLTSPDENPVGAAFGYLLQGQALRRQGQSREALQCLTASVALSQRERAVNPSLLLNLEWRASSWLASIALSDDDYGAARDHGLHQLEICQQFQIPMGEITALTCLIDVDIALGDYARAQHYAEQALARAGQINSRSDQALCYGHLAELAWRQGDYQQALDAYEQALALYRSMQRVLAESTMAQMLGRLCLRLGNGGDARQWIDQAFELLKTLGNPARETAWAFSSRARLHYLTDNLPQALVDAEAALAMVRQLDGGAHQADALVLLGLVREGLQQTAAAATAYRTALALYTALGHRHHTAEPRAGLARLALANGALPSALAEVEEVLTILQSHPLAGFDEPFPLYLTCYRVLAAHQDQRAATVIATAHDLLLAYADRLVDSVSRRSFLANVASHRAVQAAFVSAQAAGG